MNKQIVILIPLMVALLGLLYNAVTGFNGIVITTKFFPDGEDLHLGTIIIWGGIASSIPMIIVSSFACMYGLRDANNKLNENIKKYNLESWK